MTLEDDLRSALHHHADRVEPSADGLERIEARLAGPSVQRPRLAPRLLAAAAVLVAIGTVGAMTFRSNGESNLEVAVSSSTTDPSAAAVINDLETFGIDGEDPVREGDASSTVTEAIPDRWDIPLAPPGILGPLELSPQLAVEAFLDLIQRGTEEITIDLQDDLARVTRVAESGSMVDVTTLHLGSVELDDGTIKYVVIQATSPRIVIESPSLLSTTTATALAVTGQGEGFEAHVDLDLYSSRDGVWLNRGFVSAGNFGELGPFNTELAVSGSGPAWLVVQSGGGEDTDLDPFSAIPVVIDAPRQSPDYVVTNIPADDPDGGLVVRSLPGTDGVELDVLPSGQSVNKRSALSAIIGDGEPSYDLGPAGDGEQEWWNIWLPEPLESGRQWGWVNARYLVEAGSVPAAAPDEEAAALEAIGSQFVRGLRGNDAAFAGLPWSANSVTVGFTSDLRVVPTAGLIDGSFWSASATWALPEALGDTIDVTGRELVSPTLEVLGDLKVELRVDTTTATASPFGNDQDLFAAQFPGASYVQVFDPTRDSGWVLINIFVTDGADGREIVGVATTPWTP